MGELAGGSPASSPEVCSAAAETETLPQQGGRQEPVPENSSLSSPVACVHPHSQTHTHMHAHTKQYFLNAVFIISFILVKRLNSYSWTYSLPSDRH